jgi:hypothetical protein
MVLTILLILLSSNIFSEKNEIGHLLEFKDFPVITYREEVEKKTNHNGRYCISSVIFIEQIEELDIWDHKEWSVLPFAKDEIIELKIYLMDKNNLVWEIARQKLLSAGIDLPT